MSERRVTIVGSGIHHAIAAALLEGHGATVINLEREMSEDPAFGLIGGVAVLAPTCMGKTDAILDRLGDLGLFDEPATRRREQRHRSSLGFLMEPEPLRYRNRFLNPVERQPGVEYVITEAPLTKRQRRRQKGKKK